MSMGVGKVLLINAAIRSLIRWSVKTPRYRHWRGRNMKRTSILLVALAVLSGAVFSPSEVRADVLRLACQHRNASAKAGLGHPRYFTLRLKKDWSSYEYVYATGSKELKEVVGSVKDHGHKLELLGLDWGGSGAVLEKQPWQMNKRGKVEIISWFQGYPAFFCKALKAQLP